MDIRGKTAFITGGTSGIGLEVAKTMLSKGANVAVYSTSPLLPDVKRELAAYPNFLVFKGDIRKRRSVRNAISQTIKKLGSLDILINNAAIARRELFIESTQRNWDDIIDINVKGTLCVTQEALFYMTQNNSGMIINIASGAGLRGIGGLGVYSLTKAALINFTQSLSEEVASYHINVVTIAPGSTNTQMFSDLFPEDKAHHAPQYIADVVIKTIQEDIHPNSDLVVDVFDHTR